MAIPVPVASFRTTLTQRLAAADTTAYIDTTTDDAGNDLDGRVLAVTIEKGTSTEETILGTVDTATSSMTSLTRNLDVSDGTTAGTGLDHRKKSTVEVTAFPYLTLAVKALNGSKTLDPATPMAYASAPTFTPGSNQLATIAYADALAIAGSPDSSESTKGIVEMATAAESQAGTDAGSTTAPLVVTPFDIGANQQNQAHNYAADSGAADAYAITLAPVPAAYAAGQRFVFKAANACTGASTLNVNSLGVKTIKKEVNGSVTDLANNDIIVGSIVEVIYDGTYFRLMNTPATTLDAGTSYETQQFFGATDITGAEAETLTDGSPADDLHEHPKGVNFGFQFASTAASQGMASGFSDAATKSLAVGVEDNANADWDVSKWELATDAGTAVHLISTASVADTARGVAVIYIGSNYWVSNSDATEGDSILKDGSDVTISGTTPENGSSGCPLGHDPTLSYLLVKDSTTTIKRYSGIAGTTITYVDTITLGTATIQKDGFFFHDSTSQYICLNTTNNTIQRYNSSGTLQDATAYTCTDTNIKGVCAINNRVYLVSIKTSGLTGTDYANVCLIPTTLVL